MQHTEASLTLHKHERFIEMIILYYRTNNGTKIGKTIYLIQYIIAIIALTSRHLDPILHYTYDRTCSSASMFYHLPYARCAPSSYYHTHSIPAKLSIIQPLTHIYDCYNFDSGLSFTLVAISTSSLRDLILSSIILFNSNSLCFRINQ